MKKILLTLVVVASFGLGAKLNAQCTISNVSVHLNSTTTSGGNCLVNIDLTFDLAHNNGFKYLWIHMWKSSSYPTLPYNHIPTAAELSGTAANVGLVFNNGVLGLQTSYPGGGVTVTGATVSLSSGTGAGGSDRVTVSGVVLSVAGGCNSIVTILGDIWGTNSSSQNSVQCLSQAGISFTANDPTITGFKTCGNPRTLTIGIQTSSPTNITVSYKLYKDDGDGLFEPGTDDPLVADSTGPYTINSTTSYSKTGVGWTGNSSIGENSSIWVSVSSSLSSNTVNSLFANQCTALPIGLKYFAAQRAHSNVNITWVTYFESNSSGFEIQRQTGSGNWQTIAFVPTKAVNGTSYSDISYSYVDANNTRGISNYRILLVDLDGKTKYSDIRAVRGEGQIGKIIVYPNPSLDGKVKVVFDDATSMRDVSLIDATGRVVKQWKDVSNNNLQIDNLTPGFYSLRVVVKETGEQSIEKIVVNKR